MKLIYTLILFSFNVCVWSFFYDDYFIDLVDVSDTALNGDTRGGALFGIPGIAVFDCNNDGYEDILYGSLESVPHKLYINNGDFTFTEQALSRGIDTVLGSHSVAAFDFDNNGDIDLVFSYVGGSTSKGLQFYYNTGNCHFEDRTNTILASVPELWTGGNYIYIYHLFIYP